MDGIREDESYYGYYKRVEQGENPEKSILLMSPWETLACNWEIKEFDTEKEMMQYVSDHDLTKEFWAFKVIDLVRLLRKVEDLAGMYYNKEGE